MKIEKYNMQDCEKGMNVRADFRPGIHANRMGWNVETHSTALQVYQ